MPSPSPSQQRQLAAARRRATLTVKSLTEVAARFALAADIAPSQALTVVFDAVAVLISEAAEDHRTRGHCAACRASESCPMLKTADAFLPEGWVTV